MTVKPSRSLLLAVLFTTIVCVVPSRGQDKTYQSKPDTRPLVTVKSSPPPLYVGDLPISTPSANYRFEDSQLMERSSKQFFDVLWTIFFILALLVACVFVTLFGWMLLEGSSLWMSGGAIAVLSVSLGFLWGALANVFS